MDKRTKIMFFLVSTVISVIVILMSYFELTRYVLLYVRPTDYYIREYKKIQKTNYPEETKRVVVTMSTTPGRMNKLEPVLKSLLDQTMRVDQIALNLPYNHNGRKYEVPDQYKKVVNVFTTGKDLGTSANAIIPTVKREGEIGTLIISVEDNKIYGKDFIESIVYESVKYPSYAIVTSGSTLVRPEFFGDSILNTNEDFHDGWKEHLNVKTRKMNYLENYRAL